MMIPIPEVLTRDQIAAIRARIDGGEWVDGNETSGTQAALAKRNVQLREGSEAAGAAGAIILDALGRSPLFIAAALPARVFPPLFSRYEHGDGFTTHVDNAIRFVRGGDVRVRSDLSATLFLSEPEEYEGGALAIEDSFGSRQIKLAAGDMVVYPASSLHHVTPIIAGARVVSFFWIQSMVRDDAARQTLFDLDRSIQTIATDRGHDDPAIITLTGVYHNLLRRWAEI